MGKHEMNEEVPESAADASSEDERRSVPSWSPPAGATRSGLLGTSRTHNGELALARTLHSGNLADGPAHPPASGAGDLPAPLPVGAIVGQRYRILEHISSGGFGAVYRAADKEISHHQVALKLLHIPAADEAARGDAMRELALIASVSHPSVVQFKDYGWLEGRLWFAMPWYRGQTLDRRYAGTSMTRAEARPLFERLAQGLAAMHAVGVHHHDIKPENIFVAEIAGFAGGLPVLLDLGIASRRGEVPKGFTLDYAAPETAAAALGQAGDPIGAAADVFALALVLRNLLEPESQTFTESAAMLPFLHARATKPLRPPKRKDCRHLTPYFTRWLSLDPAMRPSASEFAAELGCLTDPEEQRAARVRTLKRVIPVVLLAAGLVAILWTHVLRQKQELRKQQDQLEVQMRESAALREHSEDQLQKLESQDQKLGDQRAQLNRAISIARNLNKQLASSEENRLQDARKVRTLAEERDKLTAERDSLTSERDGLVAERNGLLVDRDSLTAARDELERKFAEATAARDTLQTQYLDLSTRADTMQVDLDTIRERLLAAEQARDDLQQRLQASEQDLASKTSLLADLEAQKAELDKQLEAEQKKAGDVQGKPEKASDIKSTETPLATDQEPAVDPAQEP